MTEQSDGIRDTVVDIPGAIIPWLDATSLLANILLLLSRSEEALEYGRTVFATAILYLPDTLEQIYTTELYASCLYGVGKIEDAKEMFNKALRGIETEISEAEVLRDGIKEKLSE